MKRRTHQLLAGAMLLALAISAPVQPTHAQVLYGSLTGVVSDPTGATIPGAEVSATHTQTARVLTTTTDAEGRYSFVNAPAGTYDIRVTADGFRALATTGNTVSVNQIARVDLQLELGQVTEVITVEGAAVSLQTEKADTSAEITNEAVKDLPLPGFRNYQSLVNLVPGATPARFQNSILDTPARSLSTNINGTNRNNNVTRIDGAASINVWLPHHAGYVAPADTVETVNVTTGSGDAEQGLTGGASTTVITKSGTNELHGSAFWFHDNQRLRARNFFSPTKPVSNYNNFGGTIGGPIAKNKVFYFIGYDKTTQRVAGVRTGRRGSDAGPAGGRLQRLLKHHLRSADRQSGWDGPHAVREQHDSDGAPKLDRAARPGFLPRAQRSRHAEQLPLRRRSAVRAAADRPQGELERE